MNLNIGKPEMITIVIQKTQLKLSKRKEEAKNIMNLIQRFLKMLFNLEKYIKK